MCMSYFMYSAEREYLQQNFVAVCKMRKICFTFSLQWLMDLSRMYKPCPGIQALWSTLPPISPKTNSHPCPTFLSFLKPPPTTSTHPPLTSFFLLPFLHPQLAVEDGFSESSWDWDQRQITADVYAKCNMETLKLHSHYWFFSFLFHPQLAWLCPFLLISLLIFIQAQWYSVWNLK